MRMRSYRAKNLGETIRNRPQFGLSPNARRDRHHALDSGGASTADNGIELGGKIGEVEVAVAVDKHLNN